MLEVRLQLLQINDVFLIIRDIYRVAYILRVKIYFKDALVRMMTKIYIVYKPNDS